MKSSRRGFLSLLSSSSAIVASATLLLEKEGAPVRAVPVVVGERGPELFIHINQAQDVKQLMREVARIANIPSPRFIPYTHAND